MIETDYKLLTSGFETEPDLEKLSEAYDAFLIGERKKAATLCAELISSGSAWAAIYMGNSYDKNRLNLENNLDIENAKNWYLYAANKGLIAGKYYIARTLYETKDYERSLYWFRELSLNGFTDAKYFIFKIYKKKLSTDVTKCEAFEAIESSAQVGNPYSKRELYILYIKGEYGIAKRIVGLVKFLILPFLEFRNFSKSPSDNS